MRQNFSDLPAFGRMKDYEDQRPSNFHTMSLGIAVLCPTFMFVAISCSFAFALHRLPALVWIVVCLCVAIAGIFLIVRQTRQGTPMYWFNLGVLCTVAIVIAVYTSYGNYYRHYAKYWDIEGQRRYTDVQPSEPALSHLDAGRIFFSNDSRVDVTKAVAYQGYCVAPIVGKTSPSTVQYWSAGVDCCEDSGGNFRCGDYGNEKAKSGLVILRSDDMYSGFVQAAAKAADSASQDALFVKWVANADKAMRQNWHLGTGSLIYACALYLVMSIFAGLIVHFGSRPQEHGVGLKRRI